MKNTNQNDDTYSEAEAESRREAMLKLLSTLPKRHKSSKQTGKESQRKSCLRVEPV